jgi:hypothetical protein
MEVAAKLYSSYNEPLQTEMIHFEWSARQIENRSSPEAIRTPAPPRGRADLAPATKSTDAAPPPTTSQARTPTTGGSPSVAIPDSNRPATASLSTPVLSSPVINPAQIEEPKPTYRSRPAEEVDALLQVGERMLQQGDIAAARVALRHAAEAGSAKAARALGMSFDPSFLRRGGIAEAPDPAQAEEWYARARKLGLNDISRETERPSMMPNAGLR